MPGQRTKGQVMIGSWCDEALVEKIDASREGSRSQFCRDALIEKLKRMGVEVQGILRIAPDREGKGGPRRVVYHGGHDMDIKGVNSKPPSRAGAAAKKLTANRPDNERRK